MVSGSGLSKLLDSKKTIFFICVCLFSENRWVWPVPFFLASSSQISPTPPACFVEFGICFFLLQSKLLAVLCFLFPILPVISLGWLRSIVHGLLTPPGLVNIFDAWKGNKYEL